MLLQAKVGIIGAGNSARALAAYLSSEGHEVSLYARNTQRLDDICQTGTIRAEGTLEGVFGVARVTSELAVLAQHSDVVVVATTADAYRDVAERLAPHLAPHHRLILFSGKLCGSLEVARVLERMGKSAVPVLEMDALFACRTQPDGTLRDPLGMNA